MKSLNPMVMLATGMHSQPGVYALLLGSGVSTGAGIPTGWGVVTDLVRRAAAAASPDDSYAAAHAAADPEAWWGEHGDGQPLGYSNLLSSLAPTPAGRRDLLARFFEPTDQEVEEGTKVPSAAHRAVAQLVKRGLVRVIITTNFDRLTERALEEAGIPPQVVSRADAVAGMTPLAHARATVIKLHGDYADLQSRNTVEELSEYPEEWTVLLARVADEYGLLISGWSADWDIALVRALEEQSSRRYPLYWDSRSSGGAAATRLLAQRQGQVLDAASADDLFGGLIDSVEALDRLTEAPLTTALATARLKRYLPDPVRRIDLYDLVVGHVEQVNAQTFRQPLFVLGLSHERIQEVLADRLADSGPLLQLLATGVAHDRDGTHGDLWVGVVQRLLQVRTLPTGNHQEPLDMARHYPALLALRTMGLVALQTGRDELLLRLLTEPRYRDPYNSNNRPTAVHALHDLNVLDPTVVNGLPRWNDSRKYYPLSHLVRQDLRGPLREWMPEDEEFKRVFDAFEYRYALLTHTTRSSFSGSYPVMSGEFMLPRHWNNEGQLQAELDFIEVLTSAAEDWPWWLVVGGTEGYAQVLEDLRGRLKSNVRY